MKWREWLDSWSLSAIKLTAGFAELEFKPKDADRDAAWELYVELLTRITTQPLPDEHGDEKTALDSVYSLFALTRQTLKDKGRHSSEFTKVAIAVLNQAVRPFTAKWHRESIAGAFESTEKCQEFRRELTELQELLRNYTKALANMAGVEDLTLLDQL